MLYKGGFFNVLSNGVIEWYAGDESCDFGARPAQYPIEVDYQKDGVNIGKKIIVKSDEEAFSIQQKLTDLATNEPHLLKMMIEGFTVQSST